MVVLGHGSLTLEDRNGHSGLVVLRSRESLGLLGGDHSVSVDELGHHATDRLDTEGQGSHIQQQKVRAALAAQDSGLNSGAVGNSLIWVDTTAGLLAIEEILDQLLHLGNASGSANQHDLIHLVLLQTTVLHHQLHRPQSVLEQISVQLLESSASQGLGEINTIEEGLNLDLGLMGRRQSALGLLDLATQLLD
mmetsp:Transcript_44072/g.93780  ORF Transcript_44072/g.93780 Transcript_44072/m.93780 type:complete len:193 (+) Transcript_44072:665-1243(+)